MTLQLKDAPKPGASLPSPAANAEPIFQMAGISKHFGDFVALSDIAIGFNAGEVHCLLGENGAGKSTLCNLVFGIHQPTTGSMHYRGEVYEPSGPAAALAMRVAMVHQHFSLINELTVIDNLMIGRKYGVLDRNALARELEKLAEEFGLQIEPMKLISELSVGQRQRVEIIKCLMHRPRLLILDEPTAVLLPEEIAALLELIRTIAANRCAVVMVTHKLAEISKVADQVTVLRSGCIAATSRRPSKELDRLVSAMIQGKDDANPVQSGFGVTALPPRRNPAKKRAKEVLQIDSLSKTDHQGVVRLNKVTLTLREGEIVGIAGVEGNGQSELGMILSGLDQPSGGRWFADEKEMTHASPATITQAGVGIVPEDRHLVGSIGAMSLADNLFLNRMNEFARFGLIDRRKRDQRAVEMIDRFDVRSRGPQTPFSSLSGGNQQKAVLARELTTRNLRFLLAAHPTRGLDIGAIETVYTLIREVADSGIGVLLISSELDELIAVADRIVVFYRGEIPGERPAEEKYRAEIGALMSGQSL